MIIDRFWRTGYNTCFFFVEYRNKTITRMFGGNSRYGCYFLAIMIFSFGMLRDHLYV